MTQMTRASITDAERPAVALFIERHWGSRKVLSHGQVYFPHELDGFIEWRDGEIVGLLTMVVDNNAMQILTLNSLLEGRRIGSSLMLDAITLARDQGLDRIWLTTTNDNLKGIGFYQRLGFRIVQVNVDAVDEARKIKPEIPTLGRDGIPVHDEIVMELKIEPYSVAE
jgi:GNAT superfamily N-acetyltransferase